MQYSTIINNYFFEAKCIASIFFILGTLAIILACIFLGIIKYLFFKGVAYPLILMGFLQYVNGLFFFNEAKKLQLNVLFCNNNSVIKSEVNRLEVLQTYLITFIIIQILLLIFSTVFYFYSYKNKAPFWRGMFLGVIIQTLIFLSLHLAFFKSAKSYHNELKVIILKTKSTY